MEDTRLTANFTLAELTKTSTGLTNMPPSKSEIYSNLLRTAKMLQSLRDWLGKPIIVNSGYRSPAVNKAVGGASNSSHMYGLAADIVVDGMTPYELCLAIKKADVEFDQVIQEPNWVHFQIAKQGDTAGYVFRYYYKDLQGKVHYPMGLTQDRAHYQSTEYGS